MTTRFRPLLLAGTLAAFALWIILGFVVPIGSGWAHLFLPAAVCGLLAWVVTGRTPA